MHTKIATPHSIHNHCTDAYLCLMGCVAPLWYNTAGYLDISSAKYSFFTTTSLLYLVVLLILQLELLLVGSGTALHRKPRLLLPHWLALGYLFCCAISAALSEFPQAAYWGGTRHEGLCTLALYVAIFLAVSYHAQPKGWYIYPLAGVVGINGVLGVAQIAGYNPLGLFPDGLTYHDASLAYGSAFLGTLGNAGLYAAFLAMLCSGLLAFFIRAQLAHAGWILPPVFCGLCGLFCSDIAAGIVGFFAAFVCALPFYVQQSSHLRKLLCSCAVIAGALAFSRGFVVDITSGVPCPQWQFSAATLCCILLAGLCLLGAHYASRLPTQLWRTSAHPISAYIIYLALLCLLACGLLYCIPFSSGTLGEIHALLHGQVGASFGSSRIWIWQNVLPLVPEHLFFGGGPDTLGDRMDVLFTRSLTENTTVQASIDTAHNDYLNILANTGLLSLLCYLSLLGSQVYAFRKHWQNPLFFAIFIGLLAYLIQIFFSFSSCAVTPLLWIGLGVLVSLQQPTAVPNRAPKRKDASS